MISIFLLYIGTNPDDLTHVNNTLASKASMWKSGEQGLASGQSVLYSNTSFAMTPQGGSVV